jgi:hypothetical protein
MGSLTMTGVSASSKLIVLNSILYQIAVAVASIAVNYLMKRYILKKDKKKSVSSRLSSV